jgi:hypothetical protein
MDIENERRDDMPSVDLQLSSVLHALQGLDEPHRRLVEMYLLMKSQRESAKNIFNKLFRECGSKALRVVRSLSFGSSHEDLRRVTVHDDSNVHAKSTNSKHPSHNSTFGKRQSVMWLTSGAQRKQLEIFIRQRALSLKSHHVQYSGSIVDLIHTSAVVQLQQFVLALTRASARRKDLSDSSGCHRIDSPRTTVRNSNAVLDDGNKLRVEEERQAIILAGANLAKRGRAAPEEDAHLKEKVTQVLQEEEDRARASVTNEAVRSALGGEAKYLRWSQQAQEISVKFQTQPPRTKNAQETTSVKLQRTVEKSTLKSISMLDVFVVLHDDSFVYAKTGKQRFNAQIKLRN